jgi:hypothetical protein
MILDISTQSFATQSTRGTWAFERYCDRLAVPIYLTAMNKILNVEQYDVAWTCARNGTM